jgi:hypothetical protein
MNLRARLLVTALATAGFVAQVPDDADHAERGFEPDAVDFQLFRDPIDREVASYSRDVRSLLAARAYDALEECARSARQDKQRFANGTWKLQRFYTAFPLSVIAEDPAWEDRLAELNAWQQARPSSVTPAIALAEFYSAYAQKAAAEDRKAGVAAEDSERAQERLETALRMLENAREQGVEDPHFWRAAHAVAVGLEWPEENLEDIYQHAIALEPDYWSSDVARLAGMLAKRGGDPSDIEAFARAAADNADAAAEEVYAHFAWRISETAGGFLTGTPFEWERVQAGYRELLRRHPDSKGLLSQYCVLACRARDKAAARKCFAKLAGRADLRAFKSPREYMRQLRWASN